MNTLRNIILDFLLQLNFSETIRVIIADTILLIGLLVISIISYFIFKLIFKLTIKKAGLKSNTIFMKGLVESKVIPNLLKLIPAIFLIQLIEYIPTYQAFIDFILVIVIAYFVLKISMSIIDFINDLYNKYNKNARNKPIKGILTAIKIVIVVIVVIVVISNLLGESPTVILAGLGAMSAVLMLIFQDSILGLVAGFQMSANDLVRIGDWIEMPKYGVDGHVMDVTLTFIQVENWDKTTVTIPAYKLISESFTNWRSVFDIGGRRIRRSVNIDVKSVKILDKELYDKLMKVDYLKEYLTTKQTEIDQYNKERNIDTTVALNGRRLTNLGVYRIYLTEYLKNHPHIHPEMWRIVRQLQTTNKGVPLEVYAFSSKTSWGDYEAIMADIFDHIYATTEYFELKIYQEPSGDDLIQRLNKS